MRSDVICIARHCSSTTLVGGIVGDGNSSRSSCADIMRGAAVRGGGRIAARATRPSATPPKAARVSRVRPAIEHRADRSP